VYIIVAHNTAQNRPDNSPLALQTITIAPMMSISGKYGVQIAPCQEAIFRERTRPGMPDDTLRELCKMAEPINMLFRLWTRVGPRKHVLGGVHTGATWRISLNRPCVAAMRHVYQITLTTCFLSLIFNYLLRHVVLYCAVLPRDE